MKTALKLLLLLGVIVYFFFAFTRFSGQGDSSQCAGVDIVVTDSAHAGFITAAEADRILRESGRYPVGRSMGSVDSKALEAALKKNPFIREAVCYKTPACRLNILVTQRLPLLRVMASSGEDYYIDERGYAMAPMGYVADLAVATGSIDKDFARDQLARLGSFLQRNRFWNDQVEQINVTADHQIEFIPRIGDHVIRIGDADSLTTKFRNLMAFYQKVMPEVGWNKYERINIAHTNQIVCTKREKGPKH